MTGELLEMGGKLAVAVFGVIEFGLMVTAVGLVVCEYFGLGSYYLDELLLTPLGRQVKAHPLTRAAFDYDVSFNHADRPRVGAVACLGAIAIGVAAHFVIFPGFAVTYYAGAIYFGIVYDPTPVLYTVGAIPVVLSLSSYWVLQEVVTEWLLGWENGL